MKKKIKSLNINDDEERLIAIVSSKLETKYPIPFCYLQPFKPSRIFLLNCRRGILQFVIIKPTLALLAVFLNYTDAYGDGEITLTKGFLYVVIIDNISIFISMYCLILFYNVMYEELKPFNPLSKFLCTKLVIFFAFWQSVFMAILGTVNALPAIDDWNSKQVGNAIQEFIICIEMFLVSIAHIYAFGFKTYRKQQDTDWRDFVPCYECLCCCCCFCSCCTSVLGALSPSDVVKESVSVFGPASWKTKNDNKEEQELLDSTNNEVTIEEGNEEDPLETIYSNKSNV